MKTLKFILFSTAVLMLSTTLTAQPKPWVVPNNFKSMKNPVATSDASIAAGLGLYKRNCLPCHGKTGLGDGVKSKSLKTAVGNMTLPEFQNQTDGEHFYKTKMGRGDMTKYEGKLSDEDIWNIVNYMRTFKK